jgi:twitching motility protein PilT
MELQKLLEDTIGRNASDLHLCTGYAPTVRVDGKLVPLSGGLLAEGEVLGFVDELLPGAEAATWKDNPMAVAEISHEGPGGSRFRTVIHKHFGGSGITMRLLPSAVPSPERLGMAPVVVDRVCHAGRGLVLVSGGTGSGKSTTMYSLVDHINETQSRHIICITYCAEYVMPPKQSMVRIIEIGTNIVSSAAAARAALRLDPDVILIGEMRDLETVQLAITLVETGHLVFTTIHCQAAAEALARIVEVFPTEQQAFVAKQLAATIECVIAQRLLPRADQPGRVAAQEVLLANSALRELIAERRFAEIPNILAESGDEGMQTMRQHLRRLIESGQVKPEAADGES